MAKRKKTQIPDRLEEVESALDTLKIIKNP